MTSPFPLNNPVLGRMLQERQQQVQQPPTVPGTQTQSTPDAMNVPPEPQTVARVEHTHDIAGMDGGGLAPQPIAPQKSLAKVQPIQPNPAELAHQVEYNRLTGVGPNPNQGKPGWEQIHNPFLKTLAGIGNAASTLFPSISMAIPGTSLHHQMLLRNEKGALEQEQANRKETNLQQEEAARATDLESKPELAEAKNELGLEKLAETTRGAQAKEELARTKQEGTQQVADERTRAMLAQHGFKRDESGMIVPLSYEEMSEPQQAVHDLKASQSELAKATAELRKAQASGDSPLIQLQMLRLKSAQDAHNIAARRLGLSEQQFEMRAFGTNKGQPLEGSLLSDENKPVGTAFQQNVRPTGTERTRADLAMSAHEQLNDMRDVIKRHPEFFGPGAGRKTQFVTWIGSQDPDAQKFLTARSILADHATGVFGARSEAAIQAQKIAAGELKDNPDAILAGLNQIEKAMGTIKGRGVVKTTGSKTAEEATADPTVKAYADHYFGGDIKKAQTAIDSQKKK